MSIELISKKPLIVTIDESETLDIKTIDAGAAYTKYLHQQVGAFKEEPLSKYVDFVSKSINPNAQRYREQSFEYIDLRDVDDIYGHILKVRKLKGKQIGSNKCRFQKWDILLAKIMPSLENKKITLVAEDVSNALASTEFIVLRKKTDANINLFYLFRALRSDHFTQQAVANVTGATGRQRINPTKLLELRILVPPPDLQEKIGRAVEQEFTLHALSVEQTNRVDDETAPILGPTTLRISKASSRASTRRRRQ